MKYIEEIKVGKHINVLIDYLDDEKNTFNVSIIKQERAIFSRDFIGPNKRVRLNKEYLIVTDDLHEYNDASTIVSLSTGKIVEQDKPKIFKKISQMSHYGSFEVVSYKK